MLDFICMESAELRGTLGNKKNTKTKLLAHCGTQTRKSLTPLSAGLDNRLPGRKPLVPGLASSRLKVPDFLGSLLLDLSLLDLSLPLLDFESLLPELGLVLLEGFLSSVFLLSLLVVLALLSGVLVLLLDALLLLLLLSLLPPPVKQNPEFDFVFLFPISQVFQIHKLQTHSKPTLTPQPKFCMLSQYEQEN